MKKYYTLLLSVFVTVLFSCTGNKEITSFVKVNNGYFEIDNKPYYFIGTNFWYGAILGSKGKEGDRERLLKELDFMQKNGINNLRILVGADGQDGIPSKVMPALQTEPGKYNEELLDGLDFLLSEMGKRKMYAVLYFTNSWEWSGGYSQYLAWTGHGKAPVPAVDGWPAFGKYVEQYASCDSCMILLKNHIKHIINRKNAYTNLPYMEDPAIMSWQIANEPRTFGDKNKELYKNWLKEIAAYIRSLDSNHLISTGSEGTAGSESDINLYESVHADPNIDYLTMHIWPKNWSWLDPQNISGTIDTCIVKTGEYMDKHIALARKLSKPIVLEEFGLPRDHHQYDSDDSTSCRDKYYESIFKQVLTHATKKDVLAGCNFWAWGGFGRPSCGHVFWEKGDNYLGDPAQEEQGLNAVFDTDNTISLIKKYDTKIKNLLVAAPIDKKCTPETLALFWKIKRTLDNGIMYGHQDDLAYGHNWYREQDRSDTKDVCGDYPALTGWEIGHVETGMEYNLDSIYFSDMKRYMKEAHQRGSINTISWHGDNIVTGNNAWDCKQDSVVRSVLPGGSNHEKYMVWLDRLAAFFSDLKDDQGTNIPVIFRMYHEHTGNWFWWCKEQCTPEEYKKLWIMTVDYLRNTKNIHHLLYAYSPTDVNTEDSFLERYPGDDYVDIVGFDCYAYGTKPEELKYYTEKMDKSLEVVCSVADKTNKIPIVGETGMEGIKYYTFFMEILYPILSKYPVASVLLWRNAFDKPDHFYAPFAGHPSCNDFKVFIKKPRILTCSNLKEL